MKTPIADFCKAYAARGTARLHMPGHKGQGPLGVEALDLTEIEGADSLYEAEGIIAESEANAAKLFGTRATFYSAGGSSESVKAMCLLACRSRCTEGEGNPLILAGRNAHKSFVEAAQLIGFDVRWLSSEEEDFTLCRCTVTPAGLARQLSLLKEEGTAPAAVYVTSPDYLGNVLDIRGLANAAHDCGVPLLVDNAHGAYLKFLPEDRHPISLGADACADSAHKTLPVLTGGSYLHIGRDAPAGFEETARDALCAFGSTSPSYLILQSLDLCNAWLAGPGTAALENSAKETEKRKTALQESGCVLEGKEPLKIAVDCTASGLGDGRAVADRLREHGVECEFADRDYVVLMCAPGNRPEELDKAADVFRTLRETAGRRVSERPDFCLPEAVLQPKDVLLLPTEVLPVEEALGRVSAELRMGCPPAVLPVVPGERIDREVLAVLQYYEVSDIRVCLQ